MIRKNDPVSISIFEEAKQIHERMKVLGPIKARSTLIRDHKLFYETYPKLFENCLDLKFDFKLLEYMLQQKDSLSSSQENINDIDREVIGKLKEVYVNPLLEKLNIPTDQPVDPEMEKKFEDMVMAQLPEHLRPVKK